MFLKHYIQKDGHFKLTVVDSTQVGRHAFSELSPSPIELQLLVQGMTGALLLSSSLKSEGTLLLKWQGKGPMRYLSVESNTNGEVRGCTGASVDFEPIKGQGLCSQAIGVGQLSVKRRTAPTNRVFESIIPLEEKEIALNLARYLLDSQQIRAGIQLGVKLHPELGVAGAAGILIEALPDANENFLFLLEDRLLTMPPLGELFANVDGHARLYEHLLQDMGVKFLAEDQVRYHCSCSRQAVLRSMSSLPRSDLQEMLDEQKTFQIECSYCSKSYPCSMEDIQAILEMTT